MRAAFIASCGTTRLGDSERAFFRDARPAGLILFKRNCETPDQVKTLTAEFRTAIGEADTLVLVDQEGGRVQRLAEPHWKARPSAGRLGALHDSDPDGALEVTRLLARVMGQELASLGISMNCAPVLDLRWPETHAVIGDRAYGQEPKRVAALGRAFAEGLIAGGLIPVIKHIPGHGRASADSHVELPNVATSHEELASTDFVPFHQLRDMPAAMTAHVVYSAIDHTAPASTSLKVTQDIIRGEIGFDGLLLSDDLGMKALSGTVAERSRAVLYAGSDLALHCSGDLAEQQAVAAAAGELKGLAQLRYARCLALLGGARALIAEEAEAQLARALSHA
ncbi:MAG: beta-N-acetylhexosaminidase [Hyphomicrobiaceae bacterium]|nr:MAG: beta-N-acetylhexosaminidase [Hyphomicrobiaceae bacterium]